MKIFMLLLSLTVTTYSFAQSVNFEDRLSHGGNRISLEVNSAAQKAGISVDERTFYSDNNKIMRGNANFMLLAIAAYEDLSSSKSDVAKEVMVDLAKSVLKTQIAPSGKIYRDAQSGKTLYDYNPLIKGDIQYDVVSTNQLIRFDPIRMSTKSPQIQKLLVINGYLRSLKKDSQYELTSQIEDLIK